MLTSVRQSNWSTLDYLWSGRCELGNPCRLGFAASHITYPSPLKFLHKWNSNVALIVLLLSFPTGQIYPPKATRWVAAYVTLLMIAITLVVMAQSPGGTVFFEGALPMN